MLNLDTEAWGEFYLGCAGGLDVDVQRADEGDALPEGWYGAPHRPAWPAWWPFRGRYP
jgi:hypothetical protein